MADFKIDPNYVDVAARIREFRDKHPEGSLQPVTPGRPYKVEEIGGQTFIVYAAAAYRTPDDPRPGIGVAYEPFPGKTPYTKDSELQNAETSAWGRAIVAVLASETKKIASAEEVRNRTADRDAPPEEAPFISPKNAAALRARFAELELSGADIIRVVKEGTHGRTEIPEEIRINEVKAVKAAMDKAVPAPEQPELVS